MPKCPRSGAKLTTPSGAVVTAVPIGFRGQYRSNAICIEENGETLVSVVKEGRKVLVPLAQLTPASRVTRAPVMYHASVQDELGPVTHYGQRTNSMLNGVGYGVPSDNLETLRLYGACVRKCRRHAPANLAPCIDKCQESGGQVGGIDRRVQGEGRIEYDPRTGHGWKFVQSFAGKRFEFPFEPGLRPGAQPTIGPATMGTGFGPHARSVVRQYDIVVGEFSAHAPSVAGLAGSDDYHARNAQIWASHAVEEAEQGAGDALDRGQCHRALESLVRAERKTTMASTHATQAMNPQLREKALKSNTLVNALWREFQVKCIRSQIDKPTQQPFLGLGAVRPTRSGPLHERIAAVLGWSVQDTHGFSLQMLREMVRTKDPELAQEISDFTQSGRHIYRDRDDLGGLGDLYTLPDKE